MSIPTIRPYSSIRDADNVKLLNLACYLNGSLRGYAKEGMIKASTENYIFKAEMPQRAQGQFTERIVASFDIKLFEFTAVNIAYVLGIDDALLETYDGSTTYYDTYWTDVLASKQTLTFVNTQGGLQAVRFDLDGVVSSGDIPVIMSVDGLTTYTLYTDYFIDYVNGIMYRPIGSTIPSKGSVKVKYKCLPTAGVVLPFDIDAFVLGTYTAQIIGTDANTGNQLIFYAPKVNNSGTIDLSSGSPWSLNLMMNVIESSDPAHADYPMGYGEYYMH